MSTKFGDPLRDRLSVGWDVPLADFTPTAEHFRRIYSDLRSNGIASDGCAYLALEDPDRNLVGYTPPSSSVLARLVLASYRSKTLFDPRDLWRLGQMSVTPPDYSL